MSDPTAPPVAPADPDTLADELDDEFAWVSPPETVPPAPLPEPPPPGAAPAVVATAPPDPALAFDQGRAYEEGREFERGTTDARYEAVGVNRRLVIGAALGFVALVLLGLMVVTGDGDRDRVAADAPVREAAPPEFIDRPPPPPEFADPEPFAYQEPGYPTAPPAADPYAPPPYSDPGPPAGPGTAAMYSAPAYSDAYAGGPYAGDPYAAPQWPSTPAAAPVDPRRERYLRARGSALMVDGSSGALSVGGRTAASAAGSSAGAFAVRPRTPGALDQAADAVVGRTPDQQAAYDALDPETRSAVDEAALLMRAVGASGPPMPAATPTAPPAAPRAAPIPGALSGQPSAAAAQAPPPEAGQNTRAEFLRRAQAGAPAEPYRVEMPPREARARWSPLVRRSTDQRGPSASPPPPPFLRAPAAPSDAGRPGLSLLPGTVIPAVLLNGINSELPGDVVAQVERDVYDSASLRYVLVPKGTRLVGSYDDQIAYGQNRALVAWTTMVFPDGRVVSLPGLPGVDLQGAAGLQDRTDRHLDRVFGGAVALAAVGTGLALATPDRGDLDLSPQTVASAQVAIELSRVATELLRRELDVEPTVTVRPGYRLLVFLAREMQFDGPYTPAPDVGRFRRHAPSR